MKAHHGAEGGRRSNGLTLLVSSREIDGLGGVAFGWRGLCNRKSVGGGGGMGLVLGRVARGGGWGFV